MRYLKLFEDEIRLGDVKYVPPIGEERTVYKYEDGDYVVFIELERVYKITQTNNLSQEQDYFLQNPLEIFDRGWVTEEELRLATPEEIDNLNTEITAKRYNL